MRDAFSLREKKVVIIGGSAGMGLATAALAIDHGADVAIIARGAARLARAREELVSRGGRAVAARALAIEDRPGIGAFLAEQAPFDHLVLPGSTVKPWLYDELTDANAREAFESKFWGPFWAAYDARKLMRSGGSVVFYTGVAAERPVKGYVIGACINGALNAGVRSLALEFGALGLRCNVIAPSLVETPLLDSLHASDKETRRNALASRLPVGRIGIAEECATAALMLMTNGYITGEVLTVDGGHRAIP
jgi:NAD(P)-dependent dehydrogenase (short-subunit alcohol dehydrogenase family)